MCDLSYSLLMLCHDMREAWLSKPECLRPKSPTQVCGCRYLSQRNGGGGIDPLRLRLPTFFRNATEAESYISIVIAP